MELSEKDIVKSKKNLIALNCPNCGSALECNVSDIKITCEFCHTPILVKDLITERRIDNVDKLSTYKPLADNAFKSKDYAKAYNYYESICQMESSAENIAHLNISGILSGKIIPNEQIYNTFYVFTADEHLSYLNAIQELLSNQFKSEKQRANSISDKSKKSVVKKSITSKYKPLLKTVKSEIKKIQPIKCKCGEILKRDDETCPKCGKNRNIVFQEIEAANKKKRIIIIIACVVAVLIIGAVTSTQKQNKKSEIQQSINSGEYSNALMLIDNYQETYSRDADMYLFEADCYIGINNPNKALEVIQKGLRLVSSDDKEKLESKEIEIKKLIESEDYKSKQKESPQEESSKQTSSETTISEPQTSVFESSKTESKVAETSNKSTSSKSQTSIFESSKTESKVTETSKKPASTTISSEPEIQEQKSYYLILNTKTKKVHTRECSAAKKISAENRQDITITASSIYDAISKLGTMGYSGYELCKKC